MSAFANPVAAFRESCVPTVFLLRSTLGQSTLSRSFRGQFSKQPSVQNRPSAALFANMIPGIPFRESFAALCCPAFSFRAATCRITPILTSFIGVLNAAQVIKEPFPDSKPQSAEPSSSPRGLTGPDNSCGDVTKAFLAGRTMKTTREHQHTWHGHDSLNGNFQVVDDHPYVTEGKSCLEQVNYAQIEITIFLSICEHTYSARLRPQQQV